jgi:hypothetical protein
MVERERDLNTGDICNSCSMWRKMRQPFCVTMIRQMSVFTVNVKEYETAILCHSDKTNVCIHCQWNYTNF